MRRRLQYIRIKVLNVLSVLYLIKSINGKKHSKNAEKTAHNSSHINNILKEILKTIGEILTYSS